MPRRASTARGLAQRIIEGAHVWGGLAVASSRGGDRATLTLYPPGASAAERSRERLRSVWRPLGGALWLVAFVLLCLLSRPDRAVLSATACYAAGWLVVVALTRGRCRARRITASQPATGGGASSGDEYRRIVSAAVGLEAADAALRSGAITAAQHEAFWQEVWRGFDPARPAG